MASTRIVLLGVGHTHAHVIRQWQEEPLDGCELCCISRFPTSVYSGMLPGVIAGQFRRDEMTIDLPRFAERSGVRLLIGEVTGADLSRRRLTLEDSPPLPFDVLSVGVGSIPAGSSGVTSGSVIPIKPMQTFVDRLHDRIHTVTENREGPAEVVVVGGGVAGVEIALCLSAYFDQRWRHHATRMQVIESSDQIVGGLSRTGQRRLSRLLRDRGVRVELGQRVVEVEDSEIVFESGGRVAADCVVWVTGAAPPPVLGRLGLPRDDHGFLATSETLQSVGDDSVFAVGDCGTVVGDASPKAGVTAVRQGPVLWKNLRRYTEGRPLTKFRARHEFLKIVNTGRGRALLDFQSIAIHARWCWWLKRTIDTRFVDKYRVAPVE